VLDRSSHHSVSRSMQSSVIAPPPKARIARPFGRDLAVQSPALCPEIKLRLLSEDVDLESECRELHDGEPAPYWAFCWGSGQALARFLLDHPNEVRDRLVVDFGAGSGVVAVAAALAGAREVVAVDRDPNSLDAIEDNAALNRVRIRTTKEVPRDFDVLLASDVLYEPGTREIVSRYHQRGHAVLVSEPDRPGARGYPNTALRRFDARTLPDVDSPTVSAGIYRLE
jgi:predicted nicotinamide N-methyase